MKSYSSNWTATKSQAAGKAREYAKTMSKKHEFEANLKCRFARAQKGGPNLIWHSSFQKSTPRYHLTPGLGEWLSNPKDDKTSKCHKRHKSLVHDAPNVGSAGSCNNDDCRVYLPEHTPEVLKLHRVVWCKNSWHKSGLLVVVSLPCILTNDWQCCSSSGAFTGRSLPLSGLAQELLIPIVCIAARAV